LEILHYPKWMPVEVLLSRTLGPLNLVFIEALLAKIEVFFVCGLIAIALFKHVRTEVTLDCHSR
jgi:hypothetical protein